MKLIVYLSIYAGIFLCTINATSPCDSLDPALGGTGFVNDFSSCGAYWSCVKGTAYPATCPEGHSFFEDTAVPPIQQCKVELDATNPQFCQECPLEGVLSVPDKTDPTCMKFFICNEDPLGTPGTRGIEVKTCPDLTRFDPSIGECNLKENVDCESTTTPGECPADVNGHFPALKCIEYLICDAGVPAAVNGVCSVGMLFDTTINKCNIASAVDCGSRT